MDKINDPRFGFVSKDKLRRKLNINAHEADELMQNSTAYQVHNQAKPHYLHITPEHGTYQCDLMFLDKYKKYNSNYIGILNIIEIGTRYVFSYPFKTKSESEMKNLIIDFLHDALELKKRVVRFESDGGPEFINKSVQGIFQKLGVEYTLINPHDSRKKGIVERFNQTLRNYIERYLTEEDKPRWVDVLPDLVYNYNHTYHRTMKMEPASIDKKKEEIIRQKIRGDSENRKAINAFRKLEVGNMVRVLLRRGSFDKGRRVWSKEVYNIVEKVPDSYQFKLSNGKEYKYDEIQVIKSGKSILPNKEVQEEYKTQAHARRLNKEDIFDNINFARQHIDEVKEKPIEEAPIAKRLTRERKQTQFLRY